MELVDAVYRAVRHFPISELFVLSAQLRSAAVSVPCNIAEGFGRYTIADQRHFLRQARGSIYELQTEIEIARRQQMLDEHIASDLTGKANEVGRLLNGLLSSLGKVAKG